MHMGVEPAQHMHIHLLHPKAFDFGHRAILAHGFHRDVGGQQGVHMAVHACEKGAGRIEDVKKAAFECGGLLANRRDFSRADKPDLHQALALFVDLLDPVQEHLGDHALRRQAGDGAQFYFLRSRIQRARRNEGRSQQGLFPRVHEHSPLLSAH